MLLSTGFKSREFGGHSWGGIDSGVSFCNNSTVARAHWAFQVSQGSVEILFRWGWKRLHHSQAHLFRKRCTKFRQNRSSFIEDITKNVLVGLFFLGHSVEWMESMLHLMGHFQFPQTPIVSTTLLLFCYCAKWKPEKFNELRLWGFTSQSTHIMTHRFGETSLHRQLIALALS